jgi:hypothetical protein
MLIDPPMSVCGVAESSSSLCACEVWGLVRPIFSAAAALAKRDGVQLDCSVEVRQPAYT